MKELENKKKSEPKIESKEPAKKTPQEKPKKSGILDQILIMGFVVFWLGLIIYFNFIKPPAPPITKSAGAHNPKLTIDGDLEEF